MQNSNNEKVKLDLPNDQINTYDITFRPKYKSIRTYHLIIINIVAFLLGITITLIFKNKHISDQLIYKDTSNQVSQEIIITPTTTPVPAIQDVYFDVAIDPIYYCNGKLLSDLDSKFSVICPEGFQWYVAKNESNSSEIFEKNIVICENYMKNRSKIEFPQSGNMVTDIKGNLICEEGSITISFTQFIDTRFLQYEGESCHSSQLTVDGLTRICFFESENYLDSDLIPSQSSILVNDSQGTYRKYAYHITAQLSPTFTKENAIAIIKSFKSL